MPDDDLPGGDMSACMAMMQDDGYDEDAAARICETLRQEADAENGNVEELKQALKRGRGLIADIAVDLNSAVDRPAADSQWIAFKSVADAPGEHTTQIDTPVVFKAADEADAREEKRIAYAPAMVPRDIDKEGDIVPTPVVESAAHDYLKRGGGVDADHDLVDGKGVPVESWIEPDTRTWELPDGTEKEYPAGTWMLGIEWEAETWKRIQEGELTGLSIYGNGTHVDLEKSVDSAESGGTHKSDSGEANGRDTTMTDSDDDGPTLKDVQSEVADLAASVETVKEAVETEKQSEEEAAAMLADGFEGFSPEDILDVMETIDGMDRNAVMDALNSADKADDGETESVESEAKADDEEKADSEEKSDGEPNFSKGHGGGGDGAATAKNAEATGSDGVPSYRAIAEEEGI